ncbi:MAG: methylated-DNA--[protein]-cysteine S-methyltransferase [Clostridia bacterium]|nr:methylated-DNA--[protein]-cysteine S-methyltransferase [Clostridia bacterium]
MTGGVKAMLLKTPIGQLLIEDDGGAISCIRLCAGDCASGEGSVLLDETARQLTAYFEGRLRVFDLPLRVRGTEFEQNVYRAMAQAAYGETASYGDIARHLGKPSACRAVGRACGRNPLLIVMPCHRIVAGSGALTGFAAGLPAKRILLTLEGHMVSPRDTIDLNRCRHCFEA